jgi:hypothetical protein
LPPEGREAKLPGDVMLSRATDQLLRKPKKQLIFVFRFEETQAIKHDDDFPNIR